MNAHIRSTSLPLAAVIVTWVALVACAAAALVLDLRLADAGRSDLQQFSTGGVVFLIPILTAAVVGSALEKRRTIYVTRRAASPSALLGTCPSALRGAGSWEQIVNGSWA